VLALRALVPGSIEEFREEILRIGVDDYCINIFIEKSDGFLLKITNLSTPAANILKQTALSFGADLAVHREVITGKVERSDAIFIGTKRQLRRIMEALDTQPFGLAQLKKMITEFLSEFETPLPDMNLPAGVLKFNKPLVMGILNVTPDSFSDGGKYFNPETACKRVNEILSQGADIVDVGAESTRPGAQPVPAEEQIRRLKPIFTHLANKTQIWSVDTTHPEVAALALEHNASIVNDISGKASTELLSLVSNYRAAYILMHIKGSPADMQENPHYEDFSAELYSFFAEKLSQIKNSGVSSIIIDPGIGFGKRVEDNTAAIRRLAELRSFHRPILVGASRKSFLGKLLGLTIENRIEASLAAALIAYTNGANILRVHDIAETRKALDAAAAIYSKEPFQRIKHD